MMSAFSIVVFLSGIDTRGAPGRLHRAAELSFATYRAVGEYKGLDER